MRGCRRAGIVPFDRNERRCFGENAFGSTLHTGFTASLSLFKEHAADATSKMIIQLRLRGVLTGEGFD